MTHDNPRYCFLALTLTILTFLLIGCSRSGGKPRAIILISIDTLRTDHLGTYGYDRPTSPFIDSLASMATVFEHATSTSSWTLPAHVSLMVSRYSADHGVHSPEQRLRPGAHTLAHFLGSAGYRTGGFYSSPLLSEKHGLEQGFDHYVSPPRADQVSQGAAINKAALEWIDSQEEPFFLFLHYYDVHAPYEARRPGQPSFADQPNALNLSYTDLTGIVAERYLERQGIDTTGLDWKTSQTGFWRAEQRLQEATNDPIQNRILLQHHLLNRGLTDDEQQLVIDLYDDGVAHQDFILEQLAEALEARGLLDHALIWIVSDHGEMLYDHHDHRDHTHFLNEAITTIPMIVRLPGQVEGRRVTLPQVSLVDVMPSILDLVGLEPTGQGKSLRGLLEGTGQVAGRPLPVQVGVFGAYRRALVSWPWKLIVDDRNDLGPRLYNLEKDPDEHHDVAATHVRLVAELFETLERLTNVSDTLAEERAVEVEQAESLRMLGYLPGPSE